MLKNNFILDKKIIASMLVAVLLVISILSYQAKVNAATNTSDNELSRVDNDTEIAQTLYSKIENDGYLKQTEKVILNYSLKLKFDNSNKHIMKVENNKNTVYFVYYPILGEAKDSNYIIVMDNEGNKIEEQLLIGLNETVGKVHAIYLVNGVKKLDGIINFQGKFVSGSQVTSTGKVIDLSTPSSNTLGFWSCLNDCLASKGVAAWAITALGIICAGGCAATAGVGCLACLAAADIGAGTVVGLCTSQCS